MQPTHDAKAGQRVDEIAARLQGYDPHAMRADDVGPFLSRLVGRVLETEEVGIFDALGRILAQDLVSPISVPPHDNSAMDGYAFDGAGLAAGQPLRLAIVGTVLAGQVWSGAIAPGMAVRIMTGAAMPQGADTVLPQEMAQVHGGAVVVPADSVRPGDNRRRRGEDLRQGEAALRCGDMLGPAALGLVASLGVQRVTVWRRLRVACFSTGDELLSLGDAPRPGAVYDSNRYTLYGLLCRLGVQVIDMGVVPDDPAALEAALRGAAGRADAILTSGGVSAGEADHTRAMLQQLSGGSGGIAFWKLAIRPGRPMAVGRIASGPHSAVLFALPGNPVATMVGFLAFVRPALLRMMGASVHNPPLLRARSLEPLRKKPGRTEYQRGIVSTAGDGSLQVRTTGNQGSGVLSSMVQANGLIVLQHDRGDIAAGDEVGVMMFDGVV